MLTCPCAPVSLTRGGPKGEEACQPLPWGRWLGGVRLCTCVGRGGTPPWGNSIPPQFPLWSVPAFTGVGARELVKSANHSPSTWLLQLWVLRLRMTAFLTEINFLISHLLVYGLFWGDHIYSPKVVMLPKIAIVCLVFLFFLFFVFCLFF